STVLAQFSDTKTQLELSKVTGGLIDFHIPPAWFQSLNPFFIIRHSIVTYYRSFNVESIIVDYVYSKSTQSNDIPNTIELIA
ncbi:hypothetical protein FXV97_11365, partial [Staphylococcus pseudintermedius]|uniref:hypothetical protein n=1 Tax=Staphylococcus pseudintermedius TaxID=283734 RepID=UPI001CA46C47